MNVLRKVQFELLVNGNLRVTETIDGTDGSVTRTYEIEGKDLLDFFNMWAQGHHLINNANQNPYVTLQSFLITYKK